MSHTNYLDLICRWSSASSSVPSNHGGKVEVAISKARDWLVNVSRNQLPGGKKLIRWYHEFLAVLPSLANELDLDAAAASYVDFEKMLLGWLLNAAAIKG